MDDETIRALVTRLSRPHPSGGRVIERAAIMAAGGDSAEILRWITAHAGEPEAAAPVASEQGLHGGSRDGNHQAAGPPLRYVIPPEPSD